MPGTSYCTLSERLIARMSADKTPDGCWEWSGKRDRAGYGLISIGDKQRRANRVVFEVFVGPIPDGLFICHHCDNSACVRPSHLYAGTAEQNTRDALSRGRLRRGERSHGARLTVDEVHELRRRRARGEKSSAIAAELGVPASTINHAASGYSWRWLKTPGWKARSTYEGRKRP